MSNIDLARRNMPVLTKIRSEFSDSKPFKGLKVGMALHVTKETAILIETLVAGGAEVIITGCNPLSTQDDVAAELNSRDKIRVYAKRGQTEEEYFESLNKVLKASPDLLIDDGCDLITLLHKDYPDLEIIGAAEETTTGIIRLRAMQKDNALKIPVIAVNDNLTKHLMDNYYGTGQSTVDGILRATNTLFAGKTVVVAGYGSCGKGVALRAKGLGANVVVCEVDAFRALQATMDGHRVMPMVKAAKIGDIFVTVTGDINVITPTNVKAMKDGAILANSGHFDVEISVREIYEMADSVEEVRPNLEEIRLGEKSIFLVGKGRLANLVAAEGHPSEVMDLSFAGQALALEYLVNKPDLGAGVHLLLPEIDNRISGLKLKGMGIEIDELTHEQEEYLGSWDY